MKKIIIILLLVPLIISSQKKYSSFKIYTDQMDVSVVVDGESKGEVYMEYEEDGSALMSFHSEADRKLFTDFVKTTFNKFKEWRKIAIENNVKELIKEIDSGDFGNTMAFIYGSEWKFSIGAHTIKASMFIGKAGDVYYLLTFPEVESRDNQYMTNDGVDWIISDEKNISSLITALSPEKVNEFINNSFNKEALFK